jgi:hypothetical protein
VRVRAHLAGPADTHSARKPNRGNNTAMKPHQNQNWRKGARRRNGGRLVIRSSTTRSSSVRLLTPKDGNASATLTGFGKGWSCGVLWWRQNASSWPSIPNSYERGVKRA